MSSTNSDATMARMEKITGIVRRVTYANKDNGYAVLKVVPPSTGPKGMFDIETDSDQQVTVTGNLTAIQEGETVDFEGSWKNHPKYGTFFDVEMFHIQAPTSIEGLKRFLATSHFKGIGPTMASKLVDTFGENLPTVIEETPEKLTKIHGITHTKAEEIHRAWVHTASFRAELINLQGMGMTAGLAQKIFDLYGKKSTHKVKENPYQLAHTIWGIGFTKADEIAKALGFEHTHPERIKAGLIHTLTEAIDNGHVYLPRQTLLEESVKKLGVSAELVAQVLDEIIEEGSVVSDTSVNEDAVYLKSLRNTELLLAKVLRELSLAKPTALKVLQKDKEALVDGAEKALNITLAPEQKAAVMMAITEPVSIITGGPGTGKSTTITTILRIVEMNECSIVLTAPTGRAAKRMTEITKHEAFTLHRLLKLQPGEVAEFNEGNPLPYDVVVVDEVSMLDMDLASALVKAIKPGTHLVFVGDADQLPSVQAGNVLADLITSAVFPVIHLQTIFRQSKESTIITNSHKIRQGLLPEFHDHPTDFYLYPEENTDRVGELIVELVSETIPSKLGFNPPQVQVLAPLYKTKAGVAALNDNLQSVLNPKRANKKEVSLGFLILREGDRVMQLRNNYEKEVYNGEIGMVKSVTRTGSSQEVRVVFNETHEIPYIDDDIRELTLAYALSVHKSQGSEYPVVVMPVITAHYIMLQRNLVYTAITRAKELVVLVGTKKALFIALKNDKPQLRYSGLSTRLKNLI